MIPTRKCASDSNPAELESPGWRTKPARSFLFLQGPPSRFARELGTELSRRGLEVLRVNLCIGDWIYWHDGRSISYRGCLAGWEAWLEKLIRERSVTDIVYFADQVPYHRIAQRVAKRNRVRSLSYEYGYLRPDWIILEPGGQSAASHFSANLAGIKARAAVVPPPEWDRLYNHDGRAESVGDTVYYLSNYLLWFLFPSYQRYRMYNPLVEYLSYPLRFLRARRVRSTVQKQIDELVSSGRPFFVAPLQMQNDHQIRANSPWSDQRDFLKTIVASFATDAPRDACLVIKQHPLDNGLEDWARFLHGLVRSYSLADRVLFLDGGDLGRLTRAASGMIVINSTCGVTALRLGCPVKVLGCATYDIAGITDQGSLRAFWKSPLKPAQQDVDAFLAVLAHDAHVRGDFYGQRGRAAAVATMADRLESGQVWTGLFEVEPPRAAAAKRMGLAAAA